MKNEYRFLITRILVFAALLIDLVPVFAQIDTYNNNHHTLQVKAKPTKTAEQQQDLLINRAEYLIKKPGEYNSDRDSAEFLLDEALKINKSSGNQELLGRIYLTRSYLSGEKRERDNAEKYADTAITLLRKTGLSYAFVGDAYRQKAYFYSYNDKDRDLKIQFLSTAVSNYFKAKKFSELQDCKDLIADAQNARQILLDQQNDARPLYRLISRDENDTTKMSGLLRLAKYLIKKPGEYKVDLDSAEAFIRQAKKLNDRAPHDYYTAFILLDNSYLAGERGDKGNGRVFAKSAINILLKSGSNNLLLGDAYGQLSELCSLDDKEKYIKENAALTAVSYYRKVKALRSAIPTLVALGTAYFDAHKFDSALSKFKLVIAIARPVHYFNMPGYFRFLAYSSYMVGDGHMQIAYLLEGLNYLQPEHPASYKLDYYNVVANAYAGVHQEYYADLWAKKEMEMARSLNEGVIYYKGANIIVSDLIAGHKYSQALVFLQKIVKDYPIDAGNFPQQQVIAENLGKCYYYLHQYGKAEEYFKNYERFDKENIKGIQDPLLRSIETEKLYYALALLYIRIDKIKDAEKSIVLSFQAEKASGEIRPSDKIDDQYLLFRLDSVKGNYLSAIRHFHQAKTLEDSLFNATKNKQVMELSVKYETTQKENALRLLEKNNYIQRIELEKQSKEKLLTLGIIAILLIIAVLAYNGYRLKKQSVAQLMIKEKKINQQNAVLEDLLFEKDKLLDEKIELLGDKEVLMKEVHHRVKNNLHMISSLLESQSAYLENEALYAIQKSQHRIQAISLIHQKLYVTDKVTNVLMSVYIREIVSYLRDSYLSDERIVFNLDLDPIELDVAQAVPIGLIVNEAITNSIKYAFQKGERGFISVFLKRDDANKIMLSVSDNGIGLPKGFDNNSSYNNSLGLSLIRGLGKTIPATVTINSDSGTKIELRFSIEHPLSGFVAFLNQELQHH